MLAAQESALSCASVHGTYEVDLLSPPQVLVWQLTDAAALMFVNYAMDQTMHFALDNGQWVGSGSVLNANGLLEHTKPAILSSSIKQADRRDGHWSSSNVLTGFRDHSLDCQSGYVQDLLVNSRTRVGVPF